MKREFSIEDGFQVIMIFFEPFFWGLIKSEMVKKGLINLQKLNPEEFELASIEEKLKDDLHGDNGFFFFIVCDGTSDKYFEEVIEQRMNIPPIKQHQGLIVQEDLLLQLAIDFCEYFNKRFQEEGRDSLRFAINWLEDMRKNPDKHKAEWEMWNKVVVDVTKHGQKSLGFF